jgi:exodeoxyribonuclease VII small subunit
MNKKKDNDISSFESDLKSLQKILEDIEKDNLSLEMMIEKYREGVEISKRCQKTLQEAEQKIKEITK